ncbi:unnamed protein product [Effrenium voratum]|uniref:Uncharacterized protein n=1 Tax=Effrenium voratum TaxID=2562239 RepID=A0AA36I024_9DINO|nr:unnamed protein product [Effrenium voratum]
MPAKAKGEDPEEGLCSIFYGCCCQSLADLGRCFCPQPRTCQRHRCCMWLPYRILCNCPVVLLLAALMGYGSYEVAQQVMDPPITPSIGIINLMPLNLPTATNWKLEIICEMAFFNSGGKDFVMETFDGVFEYKDMTNLGYFELQPSALPMTLQPGETKNPLAKLTMHNHDWGSKALLAESVVQEFMWRHNPVLKLRCQTSGLVWAWQMMSHFTAEYMCQLTIYAADHGLGLLDFSDWEAVKERWKDALAKGREASGPEQAMQRTMLGGQLASILHAYMAMALGGFGGAVLICWCSCWYVLAFPKEHHCGEGKGNAARVWLFGIPRHAPLDEADELDFEKESGSREPQLEQLGPQSQFDMGNPAQMYMAPGADFNQNYQWPARQHTDLFLGQPAMPALPAMYGQPMGRPVDRE